MFRAGIALLLASLLSRSTDASGAARDLDPSFGTAGTVTLACCPFLFALQPDKKIVLAGGIEGDDTQQPAIWRLNADGSVDTGFGDGGVALPSDVPAAGVDEVVVQADGKILVVSRSRSSGQGSQLVVLRFDDTGDLDATFGIEGVAVVKVPYAEEGAAIALRSGGRSVIAASAVVGADELAYVVAALDANGKVETSFGENGLVEGFGFVQDMVVEDDDEIVVLSTQEFFDSQLTRWDADGNFEDRVSTNFGGFDDQFRTLLVQPDGKLLVGGTIGSGEDEDFHTITDAAVVRYLDDFGLDDTFGTGGTAVLRLGGADDSERLQSIALQPNGKIFGVGGGSGLGRFFVRFTAAGAPDGSLASAGLIPSPFPDDFGVEIAARPDNRLLVLVSTFDGRRLGQFIGEPSCGDHVIDPGEQCDDGNIQGGDGCDANCKAEAPGTSTSTTSTSTTPISTSTSTSLAPIGCRVVGGIFGLQCVCGEGFPIACAADQIPTAVARRRQAACAKLATVSDTTGAKRKLKVVGKALKGFRKAIVQLDRGGDVSAGCDAALRELFTDAVLRAKTLREVLRGG